MAIQQHPLPQDISSYRFRLIGDMTIKQFASLGISIVLAIVVYSLPLPFFFKYPLSFIFVILGVGMAFVPVQGRSLDVWIVAFIKSIYSPTQYSWKRTPAENVTAETITPSLVSSNISAPPVSAPRIEITEQKPIVSTITPAPEPVAMPITTSVGAIHESPTTTPPVVPATSSVIPAPPATTPLPVAPVIPAQGGEVLGTPGVIHPIIPITSPSQTDISHPPSVAPVRQLPVPFTPTTSNTLVGLTITPDSRILDGVLVEIQKNGLTLRATKSNKLGQFMFARPLENGTFQILAEKEGFQFAPYSLELTGVIVRPLKIQASSQSHI